MKSQECRLYSKQHVYVVSWRIQRIAYSNLFFIHLTPMEETTIPETTIPVMITPSQEAYIPSSTEKKRAVMMYLLVGIIVGTFKNQKKTDFELFHLKQSL